MPITKIPIVHKFGIISHSQRLELQERLLKQSYLQSLHSQRALVKSSKNPLEVSEEFIRNYNSSQTLDDRDKYEVTAYKMLERAKRRAGLRNCGTGPFVNLPMAWTELAQLAQCKGKIQEDCLDVLITSLDQSPLEKYHIPALFFLAETMLYWLRTDAVHQPYLRTGEIKLLKMGQLTFTRLFYHHMAGQLQGQIDFKNRLFTYLDGLGDCQEAYSPYPNALLSLRFIISVGKIIMADALVEPGEVKEGDNMSMSKPRTPLSRPSAFSSKGTRESASRHDPRENSHSAHSVGAISSSVHDLSPTLWHALDVWRCTNHLGGGLAEALRALATCGMGLSNENWIDTMVALQILTEAAKTNIAAMKILHSLARGVRPKVRGGSPSSTSRSDASDVYSVSTDEENTQKERDSNISIPSSSKPTLSDIYERSEEDRDSEKKLSRHSKRGDVEMTSTEPEIKQFPMRRSKPVTLSVENLEKFDSKLASTDSPNTGLKGPGPREVSFGDLKKERSNLTRGSDRPKITQESKRTGSILTEPVPNTAWKVEVGSDLPEGRASEASSVPTYTNQPLPESPGINGWHWEVAITYTDILSDICLHGGTAGIQRMALMGVNKELTEPFQRGYVSIPLTSAGLLDLAFFHAATETRDGGPNDWSWRIRFGSIQSLVKICRCLSNDKNREGMRTAAWNILIRAHSMEKDDRVLEALKVGQVHTDLENLLAKKDTISPITIGSKIASGLSTIYLPPLPPAVDPYIPPPVKQPLLTPPHKREQAPKADKKTRTSLKEEIMLATALYEEPPDFKMRTGFDLRRIVEDQWRKELQIELEMEEKERKKKLEIQQKEEEERQREIAELKAGKFRKKTKEGKREPDSRESVDKVSSEEGKQTEVVTGNTEEVNKNTTEE
ncbi:transmembrane protein 232-like isoform X2 [Ostrea edulis]|uniref:transmembrane protein 232-like isoform X2 n=1 Tax=Ostrea edulis TaxID=37623 RepID=UPI0024AF1EA1|nr:transmembrane protein 232-like isoform X2 [Ostrea edulis]XP_056011147.1 transmembrane protein 232-like isoform X2 [Ostrea edulis]